MHNWYKSSIFPEKRVCNDYELKIANANLNFSLYDRDQDDDFSQLLLHIAATPKEAQEQKITYLP